MQSQNNINSNNKEMGEPVQNENENHLIGNILAEDNSDSDLEDNKLTTNSNNVSGIPSQSTSNGGGSLSGGGSVAGQNSSAFGSSSVTGKLGFGVTGGAFGLGANAPYGGAFTNSGIPDIVGSSSTTELSAKYYGHDSPQSKKLFGGGAPAGTQPSNLSFTNLFPGDLHYRSQQQQQQQQELMRRQSGLEFNLQPTSQPQHQPAQSAQDQFIQPSSVAGAGQAVQDLTNPGTSSTGGDILKTPFGQAVGGGSQQDIYRTKEYFDYYHSLKPRDPRLPSPTFRPAPTSTSNQSSSGSNQETSSESNIKQQQPQQQVNNSTTSATSVSEVEQKMNQLNLIGQGTDSAASTSSAAVPGQMNSANPMLGSQPGFIDPMFLQQFYQFQSQGMYNNFQMMQGQQQMQTNYSQQPQNQTVQVSGRGGKKNKKGILEPPPMPKPEDSKKGQLNAGNNPNPQINRMQQPFQNMPGSMAPPQMGPGYPFPQQMLGQMFNNPQQQQSLFNNGDPTKVGQMQGHFGPNWNGGHPLIGGIPFGNGVQPQPGQQQQPFNQYQNNSGVNQQSMFNTNPGGLMNPALFSNNDQQQMIMQNYFMQSQMVNKMMMQGGNNQPYPPGNQPLGSNSNGFQGYNYGQYGYNNSQQYGRGNGQGQQNNYNQDTYQKKNQRGGGAGNHGGSNRGGQGTRGGGQYHVKANHNRDSNHQSQQYYQQDRRGGGRSAQSSERDPRGQNIEYNQDGGGDQMPPMIIQQAKSEFLEDLRSKIQNGRKIEIKDIKDHVVECSMDQYGSRFIQQKYDVTTLEEKDLIFTEILPEAHSLMNDVFGNYVVQKLFEYGTELQRATLAEQLIGNVLKLTKSMYGCRVVQKALEVISLEQKKLLVLELKDSVLDCINDQNGNHVIQKCIEKMPQDVDFIVQAVNEQPNIVKDLCLHTYGCRVIQRILENCHEKHTKTIIDKILIDIQPLTKDQFGNYVIQHILENGKTQEDKNRIVRSIKGKVIEMSNHKFASNVVEKCLQHGSEKDKKDIIDEFLESNYELSEEINNLGGPQGLNGALYTMMKDRYGNYVIQKCIEVSKGKQREVLIKKITACANVLRKQANYSRHVYNFIEKFCGETEQTSLASIQNNPQARFSDATQEQYRESYHNQGGSGGGGGGHYSSNYHNHNYHNGGGYQNQHHYQSSSSHGGHHYVQKQKQGSSGGGGKKKM